MNGPVSIEREIISAGAPLPRLKDAYVLEDRKISVVWQHGAEKIVDLRPVLWSRRIYVPLRDDDALFKTLHVSEHGDAIEWNGGIDLSAVWLERLVPVGFGNAEFRDAMDRLGMSLEGMAAELEISRRKIAEFRNSKRIPRHIILATQYLLAVNRAGSVPA